MERHCRIPNEREREQKGKKWDKKSKKVSQRRKNGEKEGEQIRLLGLGNVLITKQGEEIEGKYVKDGDIKNIPKIQCGQNAKNGSSSFWSQFLHAKRAEKIVNSAKKTKKEH